MCTEKKNNTTTISEYVAKCSITFFADAIKVFAALTEALMVV